MFKNSVQGAKHVYSTCLHCKIYIFQLPYIIKIQKQHDTYITEIFQENCEREKKRVRFWISFLLMKGGHFDNI